MGCTETVRSDSYIVSVLGYASGFEDGRPLSEIALLHATQPLKAHGLTSRSIGLSAFDASCFHRIGLPPCRCLRNSTFLSPTRTLSAQPVLFGLTYAHAVLCCIWAFRYVEYLVAEHVIPLCCVGAPRLSTIRSSQECLMLLTTQSSESNPVLSP